MVCEVADESVVVKKFQSVKAGNCVEDKTGMTAVRDAVGCQSSKVAEQCEGVKSPIIIQSTNRITLSERYELFDGTGS